MMDQVIEHMTEEGERWLLLYGVHAKVIDVDHRKPAPNDSLYATVVRLELPCLDVVRLIIQVSLDHQPVFSGDYVLLVSRVECDSVFAIPTSLYKGIAVGPRDRRKHFYPARGGTVEIIKT
jgi:hypothetical protein